MQKKNLTLDNLHFFVPLLLIITMTMADVHWEWRGAIELMQLETRGAEARAKVGH